MVSAVQELIQHQGGIQGLIQNFQSKGYGDIVQSWVGTGPNKALNADQLSMILGNQHVQSIAQKFGMNPADLSQKLSTYLPVFIDKLTPNGQVHNEAFSVDAMIKMGTSMFGKGLAAVPNDPDPDQSTKH